MVMIIITMTASYKDDNVGKGRIVHASTTYDACYKWGQACSSRSLIADYSRFRMND